MTIPARHIENQKVNLSTVSQFEDPFTTCRGAASYGGMGTEVKEAMYEYGRHLGLAFQVVDDILDFTQTSEQLGKPQVCTRLECCR